MEKKEADRFSGSVFSKFLLVWVLLNLMLSPLGGLADTNDRVYDEIEKEEVNEGGFARITPLELSDVDGLIGGGFSATTKSSLLVVYFFMISGLVLFGFRDRKSQITLYILVGLVVVFMFGFLFYYRYTSLIEPGQRDAEGTIKEILEGSRFKGYVQSCLDRSLIDGLDLVGKQGGVVYEEQGGVHTINKSKTIPLYYPQKQQLNNLTYAMIQPDRIPPEYPYFSIMPMILGPTNVNFYGRYNFGNDLTFDVTFPPLCRRDSLNSIYLGDVNFTCVSYGSESLQESLESYVENQTLNCLDGFSGFRDLGFDIQNKSYDLDLLIADENVQAFLNYSLEVAQDQGSVTYHYFFFQSRQDVRLKYIHELVQQILIHDASDLYYKLGDNDENKLRHSCNDYYHVGSGLTREQRVSPIACVKNGMEVNLNPRSARARIREADCALIYASDPAKTAHCMNASIMEIIDTESRLAGESYVFYFVIENRPPVLEMINDVNVNAGDLIRIDPFAIDPDDRLSSSGQSISWTYNYTGWRDAEWESYSGYDPTDGYTELASDANDDGQIVRVIAKDSEGLEDYQDVNLIVN